MFFKRCTHVPPGHRQTERHYAEKEGIDQILLASQFASARKEATGEEAKQTLLRQTWSDTVATGGW